MACKYNLCSMCSTWSDKSLSCFLCAGVGCRYLTILEVLRACVKFVSDGVSFCNLYFLV